MNEQISKLNTLLEHEQLHLDQLIKGNADPSEINDSKEMIASIKEKIERIEFELNYNCDECEYRECFDCPRSLSQDISFYTF